MQNEDPSIAPADEAPGDKPKGRGLPENSLCVGINDIVTTDQFWIWLERFLTPDEILRRKRFYDLKWESPGAHSDPASLYYLRSEYWVDTVPHLDDLIRPAGAPFASQMEMLEAFACCQTLEDFCALDIPEVQANREMFSELVEAGIIAPEKALERAKSYAASHITLAYLLPAFPPRVLN